MNETITRRLAWPRSSVLIGLIIITSAQGVALSVRHNMLIGRQDSRMEAGNWIYENIPSGSKLALEDYSPELSRQAFVGKSGKRYVLSTTGKRLGSKSIEEYRVEGYDYIVTSDYIRRRYLMRPQEYPLESRFYDELDEETECIFRSPLCARSIPFYLDEVYSPFWNTFVLQRPGPCIRVYRLSSRGQK